MTTATEHAIRTSWRPAQPGDVALVTGASQGLGRDIARALARAGMIVAVHYNTQAGAAERLCSELLALGAADALPVSADLMQPQKIIDAVAEITKRLGPVRLLVNNVGPYNDEPLLQVDLAEVDRIIGGNVTAALALCQLVMPTMQRLSGQVINISAADHRHRSHGIYGLAKAALCHLTESLAIEGAPNVRCNALAPDLIADNEDMPSAEFRQRALDATPTGTLTTRKQVADMVVLLATHSAFANVTGHTLMMDGGRNLPLLRGA